MESRIPRTLFSAFRNLSLSRSHTLTIQSNLISQQSPQCIQIRSASILSSISDTPGAYSKKIRRGRGPNNKGKTAGRGHKGQGQHGKVPAGFAGGQTTYEDTHATRGFVNEFSEEMSVLNLDRLQSWIDQGRINPSRPITVYELVKSGCITSVTDGIKLLARGSEVLQTPVHLFVSRASRSAVEAVENAGGTVTCRYYTPFAITKILDGQMHPIHSRLFQPTPISKLARPAESSEFQFVLPDPTRRKHIEYYRDIQVRGYLSYQVPAGQTPSLYFRMPGSLSAASSTKKDANNDDNNQVAVNNSMW